MATPLWMWVATFGVVAGVLFLDLFVFHRTASDMGPRQAAVWTAVWVGLGSGFGLVVLAWHGASAAGQYFSAYVLEKGLSVDNLFVFTVLLAAFSVPSHLQHRLLNWGVMGALCFRAALIVAGIALINRFHWVLILMGAALLVSGVHLLRQREEEAAGPERSRAIRLVRRFLPMTDGYAGSRFLVRDGRRLKATPLLAALVALEVTDLVFALDSIPAVLGITTNTYLVVTSNAFAVLGLRSLFFLLQGMAGRLPYLRPGLAGVIIFIGAKMVLSDVIELGVAVSLAVVVAIIGTTVGLSLAANGRARRARPA